MGKSENPAYLDHSLANSEDVVGHEDPEIGDDLRQSFLVLLASLLDEADQEFSNLLRSVLLKPEDLVQKVVQETGVLENEVGS